MEIGRFPKKFAEIQKQELNERLLPGVPCNKDGILVKAITSTTTTTIVTTTTTATTTNQGDSGFKSVEAHPYTYTDLRDVEV